MRLVPGVPYKIPISVTEVDRTINVLSSPTGTQEGDHYAVDISLVIPADKAVDTLAQRGMYYQYVAGGMDVLDMIGRLKQELSNTNAY